MYFKIGFMDPPAPFNLLIIAYQFDCCCDSFKFFNVASKFFLSD